MSTNLPVPSTGILHPLGVGPANKAQSAAEVEALLKDTLPAWLYAIISVENPILAAVIPGLFILACSVAISVLSDSIFGKIPARIHNMWLARNGFVERSIEVTQSSDYHARRRINDGLNKELQTAIKLYIGNNADKCLDTLARVSLLETADVRSNSRSWSRVNIHRSSEDLKRMKLILGPENNRRFLIPNTTPPIYLVINTNSEPSSNSWEKRMKTTFVLTTRHSSIAASQAHIDGFVKKCYEEFRSTMEATRKPGRFLYQLQAQPGDSGFTTISLESKGGGDGDGGDAAEKNADADIPPPSRFKKYKLSDDKDFDSLFFPGKDDVLRLVDDFKDSKGKFGIEGFPRKLGLLLCGPSGTGKTAFVKALATYLGRHIVTLPLEKIKTNQQLYDIMFEEQYVCTNTDKGTDKADAVSNEKAIFLMELDGAFDIVRSRKAGPESSSSTPALSSTRMKDMIFERADKLDLAGFLNALDGVVDSPGRVVIMSTSAVEELDAALIRPGRINRILNMNYLTKDCAAEMLTHHFGAEAYKEHCEAFEAEWARKEAEASSPSSSTTANGTTSGGGTYVSPQSAAAARGRQQQQRSPTSTPTPGTPRQTNAPRYAIGAFQLAPAELEQMCIDNDTLADVLQAFTRYPEVEEL